MVHSQVLNNASQLRLWKLLQNHFLFLMKADFVLPELSVIYSRPEFRQCCRAVPLFQLLIESNLADTFSETVLLLKAIITIPMTSCGAERCFSTLKRVKSFLRNTMSEDRLNALAMLSMEKNLIRDSANFNQTVIVMFAQLKNRRTKFLFK